MTKDPKYRFLSKLQQMAEELLRRGDSINHNDEWERQRNFLWGYRDASKTIKLLSAEHIQQVIDRAHERVYDVSRVSRIERLKPLEGESGKPDWDAFDSPIYERKNTYPKTEKALKGAGIHAAV